MNNLKVLSQAISTYGENAQLDMVIEEMSELTKEICKHKRGADNRDEIIDEMADVYITLEQIKMIFGISEQQINQQIGDIVVLCDCAEAITRNFEFWEVYADNIYADHSVFIRGLTSNKSDSFYCPYLKKVDKKYKELVDKATPKKMMIDNNRPYLPVNVRLCPVCNAYVTIKDNYCHKCGQRLE